MAELSAAAPAGVAASEQDVLLATKLHLPRPRPGFVPRPRLAVALGEGLARRLTLVCAPAGSGKTVMLADWARSAGRPVAWLSLDAADNDPVRFWRHVVAALDRARPGIAERVSPLLGPPAPPTFDGLVTALVNELDAEPSEAEVLLVLDDYHLIDAQTVHASLEFLVDHLPLGLHLVMASRSDPPLPLPRLRAGGRLTELRATDLRFTADEAAALLREATGGELPAAAVAALAARTEGWAAGLQLAALSLRGQADPAGFAAAFGGSHRYLLDYLTEEVLERQAEERRGFLLETSVLERLSGGLCDAITGRTDSQAILQQVEQAGLFLMPLDEVRGWWRYHPLFADLLRARLRQEQPSRIPALHRNAAAWSEEHGLADDAVRHALAAGEPVWAARLIEQNIDGLFLLGESTTVERWLAALPAELISSRPRLCLAQAFQAISRGDVEAIEPLLDAAEHALAVTPGVADEPFEPSAGRGASQLANIPAAIALGRAALAQLSGDAEGAMRFGRRTLAELGEGEWMLESITRGYLALAKWLHGELTEAERALSSAIAQAQAAGAATIAAWVCHHLGLVQRAQGRLDAAAATYQQALEITTPPGRPALPAAGIAYVGLAEVAYQRDELNAALRDVTEGVAACRQFPYAQPLATGLATLAWIRQASADPGGLDAIDQAGRVAPGPAVGLLNPVPAQRARLLLARGRLPRPPAGHRNTAWARMTSRPTRGSRSTWCWPGCCSPRTAPARRSRCWTECSRRRPPQDRAGSIIEIQALRALALAAAGDEDAARWMSWPGRSPWPARRAMSGCSPTRGRRWPRCWAGWSRPRRPTRPPPAASTLAAWPGCCGRSAARTTRKARGETPRRCRAWPSS